MTQHDRVAAPDSSFLFTDAGWLERGPC